MEPTLVAQRHRPSNFGNNDPGQRIHYVFASAGYVNGPHRLSLGYGKRRKASSALGVSVGLCLHPMASIAFTSSF